MAIFFAMDNKTLDSAKRIYSSRPDSRIVLFGEYATGTPGLEIPNAFAMPKDFYLQTAEKIITYAPKAVDRFLAEQKTV